MLADIIIRPYEAGDFDRVWALYLLFHHHPDGTPADHGDHDADLRDIPGHYAESGGLLFGG